MDTTASSSDAACRFCSAIDIQAGREPAQVRGVARRAAMLNSAFWGRGAGLTVAFISGDPRLQRRVADIAKSWTTETNADVQFEFWIENARDPRAANIRIAFEPSKGSWSILGKYALTADPNSRTMNLGWMTLDLPEPDAHAVVLHEFGHALGLIHEHLNPTQRIDWNVEVVTADLKKTQGWDDQTIAANMFAQYDPALVFATDVDPMSIMMYQIPASWTRNGFSTRFNTALTDRDRALIREAYGVRATFGPPKIGTP